MTASVPALVSVDEFLRTSYKPACDYIDGVLRQKSKPTFNHSKVQTRVATIVEGQRPGFDAATELTVKIREGKFLVPDIAIQRVADLQTDAYPTKPVHLCVEVLSPGDRFSEVLSKCDDFLDWGVSMTWIIDPDKRRAWQYDGGAPEQVPPHGLLVAGDLAIPLDEVFAGMQQ